MLSSSSPLDVVSFSPSLQRPIAFFEMLHLSLGTACNALPCCIAIDSPTCAPLRSHSGRGPLLVLPKVQPCHIRSVHVSARSAQRKSKQSIRPGSRKSHNVSNSIELHNRYHGHKQEHRRSCLQAFASAGCYRATARSRRNISWCRAKRGATWETAVRV